MSFSILPAFYILPSAVCSPFFAFSSRLSAPCSLPSDVCLLPPTLYPLHYALLTANCSPLTAHCSLLTAHRSLPTAHCSLLTAHCSLHTTCLSLLSPLCSLFFAFSFFLLHSSLHPLSLSSARCLKLDSVCYLSFALCITPICKLSLAPTDEGHAHRW
jgi:hypothetical protein